MPDVAAAMLARRDWTPWLSSGRLTLLVGPEYHGASEAWKLIAGETTPPMIVNTAIEHEFPALYARGKSVARHIVTGAHANEQARLSFAGPYLRNTLANLQVIVSEADVAALFGAVPGTPAVVGAAGPSLGPTIPGLRAVQGPALA